MRPGPGGRSPGAVAVFAPQGLISRRSTPIAGGARPRLHAARATARAAVPPCALLASIGFSR